MIEVNCPSLENFFMRYSQRKFARGASKKELEKTLTEYSAVLEKLSPFECQIILWYRGLRSYRHFFDKLLYEQYLAELKPYALAHNKPLSDFYAVKSEDIAEFDELLYSLRSSAPSDSSFVQ